ncbi:MAG: hypothetical protein K4305_12095, partial [Chlorobium sp.]|uniref:hypothetical protein n=1 Tax=Chlorobium sp. TaxID=1095 RepID=UPI002F40451E
MGKKIFLPNPNSSDPQPTAPDPRSSIRENPYFNQREPRSSSSWLDSEIAGWLNSQKAQQNYPISPASINQCTSVKIRGQKSFLFNPPGFRPT